MPGSISASSSSSSAGTFTSGNQSIGNFNPAPPPSVQITHYAMYGVFALVGLMLYLRKRH